MRKLWVVTGSVAAIALLLVAKAATGEEVFVMPNRETPVMSNKGLLVRTREEVASIISQELRVGATSGEIEAFFRRHSLPFSFNPDGHPPRYNSLSWVTEDHAIGIEIYVDTQRQMVGVDVRDSYSGL